MHDTVAKSIANEPVLLTCIKVLGSSYLRIPALRCVASVLKHFFLPQYKAALLPGRIPVTKVDHPLDEKIPFLPKMVRTYLDFAAFWIRLLGFLLRNCGRKGLENVKQFLEAMGKVYAWASEVYSKNLSTTARPFYIKSPRFFLIHAVDPHLMCIPSLHVMVVIYTYTFFRQAAKTMGEEKRFAAQVEELRLGALAITEAVLYVKQHSLNCISAAMYAMTRFSNELFPPEEAESFASNLFVKADAPSGEDAGEIRSCIISLYSFFLSQKAEDWKKPLLDFLVEKPISI